MEAPISGLALRRGGTIARRGWAIAWLLLRLPMLLPLTPRLLLLLLWHVARSHVPSQGKQKPACEEQVHWQKIRANGGNGTSNHQCRKQQKTTRPARRSASRVGGGRKGARADSGEQGQTKREQGKDGRCCCGRGEWVRGGRGMTIITAENCHVERRRTAAAAAVRSPGSMW